MTQQRLSFRSEREVAAEASQEQGPYAEAVARQEEPLGLVVVDGERELAVQFG